MQPANQGVRHDASDLLAGSAPGRAGRLTAHSFKKMYVRQTRY